jgi:penicillin-binding protein 1A
MGNDDYSSTKRMTGGTLPAATWHNIMAYAHQGVELRPLPGLTPPQHAPGIAESSFKGSDQPRAVLLTRKGTEALLHVERILDDAVHALSVQGAPNGPVSKLDGASNEPKGRTSALTPATDRGAGSSRGE